MHLHRVSMLDFTRTSYYTWFEKLSSAFAAQEMSYGLNFLTSMVVLLLAAVLVVAVFKRLRLSPVLGYFVAGSIIGDYGLRIILAKDVTQFAEFGVVFLLFAIGLELTFERLRAMRVHVFGFGGLQLILSSVVIALLLQTIGYQRNAAIVVGGGLALSSTAIVLQVLAESRTQSTKVGRLSLATLLMQDFAVVPLLVLVPLLAGDSGQILQEVGWALIKAVVALIGILFIGRLLVRPFFNLIATDNTAKSNELFVATTLLIALSAAWGTEHFGLSLALGAFIAGLLVAETEFQHQAEESIAPFKGLLLGLFFMTVGMSINLSLVLEKIQLLLGLTVALILVKALIIVFISLIFRFSIGVAIHTGLLLSQGGEFAFILIGIAAEGGVLDAELAQMSLLVVTTTMALTPLLSIIGNAIATWLADGKGKQASSRLDQELHDLHQHVIIAGFGRVGKMVARLLEVEHIPYVAIDVDPDRVSVGQSEGYPVYIGDISHVETLKHIGTDRATSVILTVPSYASVLHTTTLIARIFPGVSIVVRSADLSYVNELYDAGASVVVPETYETGLQLGGAVLKSIGVSDYEVSRVKNHFRAGNYIVLNRSDDEILEEEEEVANPASVS